MERSCGHAHLENDYCQGKEGAKIIIFGVISPSTKERREGSIPIMIRRATKKIVVILGARLPNRREPPNLGRDGGTKSTKINVNIELLTIML